MTQPSDPKKLWEESFEEQIERQAYNTAPVEALVRSISYYLRDRHKPADLKNLHFLEMGCGAGPNLVWLAQRGIRVSGIDIASNALALARRNLERSGCADRMGQLVEGSVSRTPFGNESFDGIIEACVFQHLDREARPQAFAEVKRLLKPGGLFAGYMLNVGHSTFQKRQSEQLKDDPGTLLLTDGGSHIYLTNIGLAHFYRKEEFFQLFEGFSIVDPCLTAYELPRVEAQKRGYTEYLQSMWTVYAVR